MACNRGVNGEGGEGDLIAFGMLGRFCYTVMFSTAILSFRKAQRVRYLGGEFLWWMLHTSWERAGCYTRGRRKAEGGNGKAEGGKVLSVPYPLPPKRGTPFCKKTAFHT